MAEVSRTGSQGSDGSTTSATTAAKEADEGQLEVLTGTRVDDGVHEAVAVTEPKHDLE